MPDTATLLSIFSLPPDERRAVYEQAQANAMEAAHQAAIAHKERNKPDPREQDYLAYRSMGYVCALVVRTMRPCPASIECTRDGAGARFWLSNSKARIQPESDGEFLLVAIPKWLAQRVGLTGTTPELSSEREWTPEQRETWEALKHARNRINTKIYFANRRAPRRQSNFTRNDVA